MGAKAAQANPDWEAKKALEELQWKWGRHEVQGLDPSRAEALALSPTQHQVGYTIRSAEQLPPALAHAGASARLVRRTAELMLRHSIVYASIEERCKSTQEYFDEVLRTARMQYEGYRAAAEVLGKILARPPLLDVWEKSCPGLLRAKTRELALQTEGTASYDGAFVEKLRIEQIYSAVVDLKSLETERPIRECDIRARFDAVSRLAAVEQAKVMAQEKLLAEELAAIGDGSETVAEYAGKLAESLSTSQLRLSDCKLLQLPPLVCSFIYIEVLDLSANALEALPPEICQLTALKKLYAVDNKLATVPDELWKLHRTLMYLALGGNPLVAEVRQLYLEGLPVLLAHLKLRHRRRRREATSEQGFFPRLASHHGAEAIRATRSASEPNKGVLPFTSYPPTPLPAKRGVFTRGVTLDDTDLPDYRPPRDRAPAPGVAPPF